MFTASKTPPSQKRATDIANIMDMANDPSIAYKDTENRMQQRQRDIDTAWAADPAWEEAPDSVKTAMTLAADAAGGTANTGDLLSKAQAVQAEQNPDNKIRKQNSLADSVATLVGKKPASDDQSINFAALANNIANNRYSGDAQGKDWAQKNAARFTGDNSLTASRIAAPSTLPATRPAAGTDHDKGPVMAISPSPATSRDAETPPDEVDNGEPAQEQTPQSPPGNDTASPANGHRKGRSKGITFGNQVAQVNAPTSQNTPNSVPARQIDMAFIHANEGYRSDVYVPVDKNGKVIGKSGPTIGHGIDLGQMNANEIDRMVRHAGLPKSIANKIRPYLGLTKTRALNFVQNNPLNLTSVEIASLQKSKQKGLFDQMEQAYDRARKRSTKSTIPFTRLPPSVQTVVASVAFQYGSQLDKKAQKFLGHIVEQNWPAVLNELRNYGDATPSRRRREADYLEHSLRQTGLLKP